MKQIAINYIAEMLIHKLNDNLYISNLIKTKKNLVMRWC